MLTFGDWHYTVDREATKEAYARAPGGYALQCSCAYCKNFIATRDAALPAQFQELLQSLGVDASKEGEVYHEGRLAPGKHCYGGWYHFVGSLVRTGDFAPVEYRGGDLAYMCSAQAPHLSALDGLSLVQLEFRVQNVAWVISDEEPV